MNFLVTMFDRVMRRYMPDPLIFAILLSFLVAFLSYIFTPSPANKILYSWGSGFWNLSTFTLQMVMILLGGYLIASSPPLQKLLKLFAKLVKTPSQAVVAVTLITAFASWLNWGLGLVTGAFLAIELTKRVPKVNFRLLVASSYSGFIIWHGGLSGSIPLVVNTEGNFAQQWIGGLIPTQHTTFSTFNLIIIASVLTSLLILNWLLSKTKDEQQIQFVQVTQGREIITDETPAEKIENNPILGVVVGIFGMFYMILEFRSDLFKFDLNRINFILLFTAFMFHGKPKSIIKATLEGGQKIGPLLIQYPFYAAIMSLMVGTGLADIISSWFVLNSNENTFSLLTFLSAGLVNFFVPSGGGQWAVQAPIVIPAAQTLGIDLAKPILAVAWGDAWTNLAQPFWALPILAIAGLKARDIMGYCVLQLIVSGAVLAFLFSGFVSI